MDKRLMSILQDAHRSFLSEGFILLGVFGSRARGDFRDDSDLDLLYRLEDQFYRRNVGWDAVGRLEEIRKALEERTGVRVDIANAETLHTVSRKYILPEIVSVA